MRVLLMVVAAFTIVSASPDAARQRGTSLRNESYVPGGTPDQVLDLDIPATPGFATVIFIHGGSLQEGGERRSSPVYAKVCEPFLAAGVACGTIDYRLAPAHQWPAMPLDVAAAFKWVRARVVAQKGDPARVFLFGHSSGCHLAAAVAANPKYLATVGLTPSDVAGIMAMGCVLAPMEDATTKLTMEQLRERWPKSGDTKTFGSLDERLDSDPSRFIGAHMPPTLVIVAEAERFFPAILEQGAKFVRRLLEMQRPADLVIVPGKHYTSIGDIGKPGDPTLAAIQKFMTNPGSAGNSSRQATRTHNGLSLPTVCALISSISTVDIASLLPLPPASFHILMALAEEDRHGYAIIQDIASRTGGGVKLGAGTLYRTIQRLLEDGLIIEIDTAERPDPDEDDERRRYYRITAFGKAVARAETQRLADLVRLARASGLAPKRA